MIPLVLKFGGSSLANSERMGRVADIVAHRAEENPALAVVVSAMGGETDRLFGLVREVLGDVDQDAHDERDVVVSSGEQVSAGLLALFLRGRGLRARSWLSWQIPLQTSSLHACARIEEIGATGLRQAMMGGEIAVIAGYQGISSGRLTTLGRGGSDTSAVALAAALQASSCDIYTDVDGVYTSDPRLVSRARRLERIAHEEMLELASSGAQVLQTRSVELAMVHGVRVRVLSSFSEGEGGSLICREEDIVEKPVVTGIASSFDETRFSLLGLKDSPGIAARIFSALAEIDINVDMIVQAPARADGVQNLVFTVSGSDAGRARELMESRSSELGFDRVEVDSAVAKVSIVGVGMRSHTGVACTMFQALSEKGVNIQVISTSEIRISVLIDESYTELAVRALHTAYGLDSA